jgi:hypothetical protein
LGPELAKDAKGILELRQDGLLVFGSPSFSNKVSFQAVLAHDGSPYSKILDDIQDETNEEVPMRDLEPIPVVGMQHGSNRRATLVFQGDGQLKTRISLDAVPIVNRELGSNFVELFPMEDQWKILPWSSLQGPTPSGDAELEMDALYRHLNPAPPECKRASTWSSSSLLCIR